MRARYTIWQFMFPGFPFTPRPIPREDDVRGGSHGGRRNFQHRNKRRAKTDKGGGSRKKRIQDKSVSEESQSTLTSLITLTSGVQSVSQSDSPPPLQPLCTITTRRVGTLGNTSVKKTSRLRSLLIKALLMS